MDKWQRIQYQTYTFWLWGCLCPWTSDRRTTNSGSFRSPPSNNKLSWPEWLARSTTASILHARYQISKTIGWKKYSFHGQKYRSTRFRRIPNRKQKSDQRSIFQLNIYILLTTCQIKNGIRVFEMKKSHCELRFEIQNWKNISFWMRKTNISR